MKATKLSYKLTVSLTVGNTNEMYETYENVSD
jgi:hypothetical protein